MMFRGKKLYAIIGALAVLLASGFAVSSLRRAAPDPASMTYNQRQILALDSQFEGDIKRVALVPHYTLMATVDLQDNIVSGEMNLHYTNRSDDMLWDLTFRLYPNADTIYGGGSLTLDRITQDNTPLDVMLSQDETVAQTALNTPLAPGDATTIALTFTAQVPEDLTQGYGIFARTQDILSLAGWYPILAPYKTEEGWLTPPVPTVGDAMMAETALYEVSLTVPADYHVVSTGSLVDQRTEETQTTWHFVSGPAREFAAAISDQFRTTEITVDGVTLRTHTLPAFNPVTTPEQVREIASAVFSTYIGTYGPYRFQELDIVHTSVSVGGYEFPGIVYVEEAKRTSASQAEYEYLLAHELAHQWWYAQVGSHTVNAPWLDEGMATYSIVLYRNRSALSTVSGEALLQSWRQSYGTPRSYDPPVNSPASGFTDWASYRKTAYIHSALFINALRQAMGDNTFFRFLRDFTEAHRYQIVTTETFLDAAQDASEEDLTPLFSEWFDL